MKKKNLSFHFFLPVDPWTFGGGSGDFHIVEMSNMNNDSWSKFGSSYQYPSEYNSQSYEASNYLIGCINNYGTCSFSNI